MGADQRREFYAYLMGQVSGFFDSDQWGAMLDRATAAIQEPIEGCRW